MTPLDRGRTANLILFIASIAALAIGIAVHFAGHTALAGRIWLVGSLPVFVSLLAGIIGTALRREYGLDILALLSIGGAMLLGEYLAGAVVGLMLASGRALEDYARARAQRDMTSLLSRAPRTATRYEESGLAQVALDDVAPGDRLMVRSGEVVPVDGTLLSDNAVLDESTLTGEPLPVQRVRGQTLYSGTVNAAGPFDMIAASRAADSTLAGIIKLVQSAQRSRSPSARLADRYALLFVPVSLAIAGAAWLATDDAVRGLAVLVVATPCPLILAVPVAIVAGMSRSAKRGILMKGGDALEQLAQAKFLFFDKTGTLTGGRARVAAIEAAPGASADEVLRLAASLDQASGHVIAEALVTAARERGLQLSIPSEVNEQMGAGVSGIVEGKRVALGNYDYVSRSAAPGQWSRRLLQRTGFEGASAVFLGTDGVMAGALQLADEIRLDTPRALRILRREGISHIAMLTGDRHDVAEAIGSALGVDEVFAEKKPAEKLAAIASARARGVTIMIGDGVNDAPALAAADVGVAMGARGAAASSEAADVILMVDRLDRLADAVQISRQSRAIAIQSVVAGMGLAFAAMAVAAFGYLPPFAGAIVQEVIDVAVILNSLRALGARAFDGSQRTLARVEAARLKAEHAELAHILDRVADLAGRIATLAPDALVRELTDLDALLHEHLLPHERQDDLDVYPTIAKLIGGDDPMAAMSRAHREIFRVARMVTRIVRDMPSEGPDTAMIQELQRILYSFDAILRLHFAQEEEIYHSLSRE